MIEGYKITIVKNQNKPEESTDTLYATSRGLYVIGTDGTPVLRNIDMGSWDVNFRPDSIPGKVTIKLLGRSEIEAIKNLDGI